MTKKKKKSVFSACFSCFSRVPIGCDELTCPDFVGDITDFEYIVENMSIKKIPKKFLNETPVSAPTNNNVEEKVENKRDFNGQIIREVPPETWIGPVTEAEDAPFDLSSSDNLSEDQKFYKPKFMAAPICMICENRPPFKRPGVAKTFHARTKHILDEATVKELLTPHATLIQKDEPQKQKIDETLLNILCNCTKSYLDGKNVIADIHESNVEEDTEKYLQNIPPEIKETIDALKVARPFNSKFSSRNHRSLVQSSSNTSCDKGTFCNLSDEKFIVEEEKPQKNLTAKKRYISPNKIDASSSTSDFQETAEYNRTTSSDLQSSEKLEENDSVQMQSLKWKIIINKHKKDLSC